MTSRNQLQWLLILPVILYLYRLYVARIAPRSPSIPAPGQQRRLAPRSSH